MLNDDVRVGPTYVSALVAESERVKGGVVGSTQVASTTGEVLDYGYRIDYFGVTTIARMSPDAGSPDALPGRGTLYPMAVVRRIGVIRSRVFPHYFGDLEYSARAAWSGATLSVSRAAIVRTDPVTSDQHLRARGLLATALGRSKSNLLHRAAFYSMTGPPWLRVWAVPRLVVVTLLRGLRRWLG
jgi:GT2 family glycosyltransferase